MSRSVYIYIYIYIDSEVSDQISVPFRRLVSMWTDIDALRKYDCHR